jgi:molybdenum cofactor cytidylyltransferase
LDKNIINGLVIAAGVSGRMKKFKPLLQYKCKTFIQNIILKLNPVCDKIIIVTGYKAKEVKENVNDLNINSKIEFVFNPDYEKGMFTSLQAGVRKVDDCNWILYHFVDQPGLPENFYSEFVKQIDNKHNWIQPKIKEQKGHPVLIKRDFFQKILDAPLNSNLRSVSNNPIVKKKFWECGYAEIFQDIDTPQDYEKIKEM